MQLYRYRRRRKLYDLVTELELRLNPVYFEKDREDLPTCPKLDVELLQLFEQLKKARVRMLRSGAADSSFCPRSKLFSQLLDIVDGAAGCGGA